jgi:hypothetical protein
MSIDHQQQTSVLALLLGEEVDELVHIHLGLILTLLITSLHLGQLDVGAGLGHDLNEGLVSFDSHLVLLLEHLADLLDVILLGQTSDLHVVVGVGVDQSGQQSLHVVLGQVINLQTTQSRLPQLDRIEGEQSLLQDMTTVIDPNLLVVLDEGSNLRHDLLALTLEDLLHDLTIGDGLDAELTEDAGQELHQELVARSRPLITIINVIQNEDNDVGTVLAQLLLLLLGALALGAQDVHDLGHADADLAILDGGLMQSLPSLLDQLLALDGTVQNTVDLILIGQECGLAVGNLQLVLADALALAAGERCDIVVLLENLSCLTLFQNEYHCVFLLKSFRIIRDLLITGLYEK